MRRYLAIFHRCWLSDPAHVYDNWFEEFVCEPKDLQNKLMEVIGKIPRETVVDKRTNWAALTAPKLVQVIPLD